MEAVAIRFLARSLALELAEIQPLCGLPRCSCTHCIVITDAINHGLLTEREAGLPMPGERV